jgi:glucokinase
VNIQPNYIGGLDIGGTKMTALVADADRPLARITEPTCKTGDIRALPEQALGMLRKVCAQAGLDLSALDRVGVSSAGPFACIDGKLGLATPNICGARSRSDDLPNDWDVIPLEAVLREQFAHVVIENDCVAALSAERSFGAVQDEPDCVYVTWSTGVGFGLCVDGHILHGKHGNAGHAGHMLLSDHSDAVCGCGNRGDLEGLISGRNIGKRLMRPAPEIFSAARNGDVAARAVALDAARWFGRGLYNVAVTLDTSVFVLGGSVWQHHGDWLSPLVQREIESRLPALTQEVSVVSAALGSLVADIGALSLVMPPEWVAPWRQTRPWETLKV